MIDGITLLNEYDNNSRKITSGNANYNISFSGKQSYVISEVFKEYALTLLSETDRKRHLSGDLYYHNLSEGFNPPYCVGGSLFALLTKGLICGDVTSKPAKHFDSVVDHVCKFFEMQSQEASGAIALSDFNTLLAPFVRYDALSRDKVRQVLQRMVFNLSYPIRKAFQSMFTNLSFNLNCPKQLASVSVMIGGKPQDSTYANYEMEANVILEEFTNVLLEGDGAGRPFTFPVPTLNLTNRTDFDSPTFEKVMEAVTKLGSFTFMNYRSGVVDEETVRSMCCRLSINVKELSQARGLWNMGDGMGSNMVTTLNLGRLGYLTKKGGDMYSILDEWLASARRVFKVKREMVQRSLMNGYLPLSTFFQINLNHYFNTVGIVGLNDMYINMDGLGVFAHVEEAKAFLHYISTAIKRFQEEDGVLYNLELTPAEECAGKLAVKDVQLYPDIKTLGTRELPYYSSLVIPPSEDIFWMYKLDAEAKLLPEFSGGTVHRIFLGVEDTLQHAKWMVKKVSEKTVPYFDFTPVVSYCPHCQTKTVGAIYQCGVCGFPMEVYTRVVGYVQKVSKFGDSRQAEFITRIYMKDFEG